jgi:hypothetical protein
MTHLSCYEETVRICPGDSFGGAAKCPDELTSEPAHEKKRGLELIQAVSGLKSTTPLQTRVGIATGPGRWTGVLSFGQPAI